MTGDNNARNANSEDILRSRGVVLAEYDGDNSKLSSIGAEPSAGGIGAGPSSVVPTVDVPALGGGPASAAVSPVKTGGAMGSSNSGDKWAGNAPPVPIYEPRSAVESMLEPQRAEGVPSVPATAELSSCEGLEKVTNMIAACVRYSGLSIEEGFGEFDRDQDGRISLEDLGLSCEVLDFELAAAEIQRWYRALDPAEPAQGISLEDWRTALRGADAEGVLKSRGVSGEQGGGQALAEGAPEAGAGGVDAGARVPEAVVVQEQEVQPVSTVSNMLAALLTYNELPLEDAFDEFDVDKDGRVSREDLDAASRQLQIDLSEADLRNWHSHFNGAGDGLMTVQEWMHALTAADVEGELRSRGVELSSLGSARGESEADALATANATKTAAVSRVAAALVAVFNFNEIDLSEGFFSLDVDEDGVLSTADLNNASVILQLDLPAAELADFLAHIEAVGGGSGPAEQMAGFKQVLIGVDGDEFLQSRGIDSSKKCACERG